VKLERDARALVLTKYVKLHILHRYMFITKKIYTTVKYGIGNKPNMGYNLC
jgi:hypothetical protein